LGGELPRGENREINQTSRELNLGDQERRAQFPLLQVSPFSMFGGLAARSKSNSPDIYWAY
jgi:hypothetical protein